ncbi:Uncharacterised protein [BD1-7 clade bacterium]|uniref:Uncharacterized protein n=1 Tax=BD1-7 clade bacterium TaxID=2029982 RepID=A0A5S9NYY3_9GAMM|nr:Uncharacterised protein [BD1-7 clade bacterium]CAA0095913.1 Uncharacterised protein [BD1-7 clade bacterium]
MKTYQQQILQRRLSFMSNQDHEFSVIFQELKDRGEFQYLFHRKIGIF